VLDMWVGTMYSFLKQSRLVQRASFVK
jgi:hypothetical protein